MISSVTARYRRALVVLLLVGFAAVFLLRQRNELGTGLALLQRVNPFWFLVLITTQLLLLVISAATYRTTLNLLGHRLSIWRLIDIHLQRHVVGAVTPLGGPASVYVFVRAVSKRGIGTNDALFAITIRGGVGAIAFAVLVIPTILVSHPSPIFAVAATILASFVMLIIAALTLLMRQVALPNLVTRWMPRRVLAFADQARQHGIRGRNLITLFALAVLTNLGGVAMLFISLRAIGQDASIAHVFTGYSIGNVLQMVAPVAQGFGLVEVTMAAAMQQVGIAAAPALAATLLYRLGDLWTPLVIGVGLLLVRYVGTLELGRELTGRVNDVRAWTSGLRDAFSARQPSYRAHAGAQLGTKRDRGFAFGAFATGTLAIVSVGFSQWPIDVMGLGNALTLGAFTGHSVQQSEHLVSLLSIVMQFGPFGSFMSTSQALTILL